MERKNRIMFWLGHGTKTTKTNASNRSSRMSLPWSKFRVVLEKVKQRHSNVRHVLVQFFIHPNAAGASARYLLTQPIYIYIYRFHVLDCWFIVIVQRLVVCCDSSFSSIYSFHLIWFIGYRARWLFDRPSDANFSRFRFLGVCICDSITNNVHF